MMVQRKGLQSLGDVKGMEGMTGLGGMTTPKDLAAMKEKNTAFSEAVDKMKNAELKDRPFENDARTLVVDAMRLDDKPSERQCTPACHREHSTGGGAFGDKSP
jgi:hypothetical protein